MWRYRNESKSSNSLYCLAGCFEMKSLIKLMSIAVTSCYRDHCDLVSCADCSDPCHISCVNSDVQPGLIKLNYIANQLKHQNI